MSEPFGRVVVGLFILLLIPVQSSESAEVTLRGGSVYSSMDVLEYDGLAGKVSIGKAGKVVEIDSAQVSTIDFADQSGHLSLVEGGAYANLTIVQFDFPKGRLTVRRGNKTLNLPLADIAKVAFPTEKPEVQEPEIASETTGSSTSTSEQAWTEEGLYSNLPNDFGERKVAPVGGGGNDPSTGYTPRWKSEPAKSTKTQTKSETTSSSRKAVTPKSKARADSSPSKRETARDRREARGAARQSTSGRDSRAGSRLLDSGRANSSNETEFGAGR